MVEDAGDLNPQSLASKQISWLITLRWIAAVSVILTVFIAGYFFKFSMPVVPLYGIAFFLLFYNLLLRIILSYFGDRVLRDGVTTNRLANFQITVDLTCLVLLLHFSGGIENPFIFYFIFHVVIAGILLSSRAAFLQVTYAVLLFLTFTTAEYIRLLPHYHIYKGLLDFHTYPVYLFGVSVAFVSTMYIATYMTTHIIEKLHQREQSLREANQLLDEKDRMKSEYVQVVTHDIKEDLAAIHTCIDPVVGGITGPLNERQDNLLRRARDRSRDLVFYVDSLLRITKLKLSRELKMEDFSFPDLAKRLINDIHVLTQEKNIQLHTEIDPDIQNVKGVHTYFQVALWNILVNAVKYTLPGGDIYFQAGKQEHGFRISIRDTGIGIPKDELPHVFDEFFRAKNAIRLQKKGTGLGLSMAQKVVEVHHGKIWVESEEGNGSTFYLEFYDLL